MRKQMVAVIGAGRWGKNHIRTLHEMGILGAVIESDPVLVSDLKSQYPTVSFFASVHDDGALDFDAYSVVVPAQFHYEVARFLLENDKHVLVEKPLTLTLGDAEALVALARLKQRVLMVGHLLLFHPAIRKIKQFLDEGKLGKLQYIYSNRLNLGTVRTEENSLWSFAPHDLSLFHYFVGQVPTRITSTGGAFIQPHIHDSTMTVLHYPDNIVGHIFVSWLHPFKEHRLVLIGSKGMISYEDSSDDKALYFYEKGIDWINGIPLKRDGDTVRVDYEVDQPLRLELQHFLDCIAGQVSNDLIDGTKGVDVLRVLEHAQRQLDGKDSVVLTNQLPYFVDKTAVVDAGVVVGDGTQIWHFTHVLKDAQIGKQCRIGQNVCIGKGVKIGDYVKIQNNVSVYEGVELEDYVFCGPSMVFTNIVNPRSKYPQASAEFYKKTLVKEGASIGANATIVCGVTLGRFCFIGAGAVVTKDVPDFALIVGNPGRIVGWMSEGGDRLDFSKGSEASCSKSGKKYRLVDGRVVEL